ncbi:hypothetical protein BH24CHL4_BH24CHL4_17700 [soil metagenome]
MYRKPLQALQFAFDLIVHSIVGCAPAHLDRNLRELPCFRTERRSPPVQLFGQR